MQVPVGPHFYTVKLVNDYPKDSYGNDCLGTCDTVSQIIRITLKAKPYKRLVTFWHEYGHALKTELDITEADALAEESLCNLIGLGMAFLSPRQLCALHALLTRGGGSRVKT